MQSHIVPEILFYIKMPYACTQDFRYVMAVIPAIALTVAYVNKVLTADGSKLAVNLGMAINFALIISLISSSILYCVCI